MPNTSTSPEGMRVALLYQNQQSGSHLKLALGDLGASIVYEALASAIDRDALEGSGARVVVVNLDGDGDALVDNVYDLLDAGNYEIIFNDSEASAQLSGWDHARWSRHLAAKILKRPEISVPPRPAGAASIPTPVQKSAASVPTAEKPGAGIAADPMALMADDMRAFAPETSKTPTPPRTQAPTLELPIIEPGSKVERAAPPQAVPELTLAAIDPPPSTVASESEFSSALDDFASSTPTPVVADSADTRNFAAELDALFADAADAGAGISASNAAMATATAADNVPSEHETNEFSLADFDLEDTTITLSSTDNSDDFSAASPTVEDAKHTDLALEFPAIFDHLDAQAAGIPEAADKAFKPADISAKTANESPDGESMLPSDWSLDLVDDEKAAAAPTTGKANFGIEKIAADEYLAPKVEAASAQQTASMPSLGGLSLELMPMEEAIAPGVAEQAVLRERESWLDGSRQAKKLQVSGVSRVLVLGASIGGPEAVRDFLAALPADFPALFVLVQHMGEEFLELMSAQLAKALALTVRNPGHLERVGHGDVIVVPTTHRLKVDAEGVVKLAHLPEKTDYSPSIDLVLRDVADAFGDKAAAIIFSGMAQDAVEGCKYLKSRGGAIWVQDPETCAISTMVDGVQQAGVVTFLGSPQQLAAKLIAEQAK